VWGGRNAEYAVDSSVCRSVSAQHCDRVYARVRACVCVHVCVCVRACVCVCACVCIRVYAFVWVASDAPNTNPTQPNTNLIVFRHV
jgi:hypothetical protein